MTAIKHLLTIATVAFSLGASAQTTHKEEKATLSQSITQNRKTLHIKITGTVDKKSVNFEKTYDIKGLSKAQVDSIKKHVTDSLNIN